MWLSPPVAVLTYICNICSNLPHVEVISVMLYREADKKKKRDKNTLVGYVNIPTTDLQNRQISEKWYACCANQFAHTAGFCSMMLSHRECFFSIRYTLSSAVVGKSGKENKTELPQIRLKLRYQTVQILPLASYNALMKVGQLLVVYLHTQNLMSNRLSLPSVCSS